MIGGNIKTEILLMNTGKKFQTISQMLSWTNILLCQITTNLSNVIKGFKISITKWSKKYRYSNFKWQRSSFERIIRNERELFNIRKYVQQNPLKWKLRKVFLI